MGVEDCFNSTFFIGTSGWTYDHWLGNFYPDGLPKSRWFKHYASVFNCVEVNATFYRAFQDQTYRNWKDKAPPGFSYVLKVPRLITHLKHLLNVEEDIAAFYRSCCLLQEKFGMALLQVAPGTPCDPERLSRALKAFPDPRKVAVEFRHPCWSNPQTEDLLRKLGATFCNVDSPNQKLTGKLTSDTAYLRLHGRHNWYCHDYSEKELEEIAGIARDLNRQGARQVYIFFNNDFGGYAPANAMGLAKLLRNPGV